MSKIEDVGFWKAKLLAFLHDPPCKCFNIAEHEKIADSFRKAAGIEPEDHELFSKTCDHLSSAADRFPFPRGACTSTFTGGADFPFKHPFCDKKLVFNVPMQTAELAEEIFQKTAGGIPRELDWRATFFLYWRRWPEESARQDMRLAYLPADTRIPDHTIWNHMSLTSAFQACVNGENRMKPAFLQFQLGPVQEFIAAAKSTRDLAAGSYLLAWLTAHAMKAISDEIGPDCILFPSLRGQPLFDLLHKPLYESILFHGKDGADESLWDRMYGIKHNSYALNELLRPTIPNRFCALVPAWRADELGILAERAVHDALKKSADAVWPHVAKGYKEDWKAFEPTATDHQRWKKQLELFPQITWTVTEWKENPDVSGNLADTKAIVSGIYSAEKLNKETVINPGFYWQAHLEASMHEMAGRRNIRDFTPLNTDANKAKSKKDRLTGRDEEIGSTGYSAVSLLKRLFHEYVLYPDIGAPEKAFWAAAGYEDTRSVAEKNPLTAEEKKANKKESKNPYIAVIALDGDEMGKWMSGEYARPFLENLAGIAPGYFREKGVGEALKRVLSPGYHLQFSEALSNVALYIANKVVTAFNGQLIYAGGDDVVAMLPAGHALHCAMALRCCFRGQELPDYLKNCMELNSRGDGFVDAGRGYPLMVPGLEADVSCGIAIGHFKHPLQALVREAQNAEKRAKNVYDRKSFAMSLMKRSGEVIHWGGKWDSSAIPLFDQFNQLSDDEATLSGRFPYALADLLKSYRLNAKTKPDPSFEEVIRKEFLHVLKRQSQGKLDESDMPLAKSYLSECVTNGRWEDFANLFLAATFINRQRGE